MEGKPINVATRIPVIGASQEPLENKLIQALAPSFQQIFAAINDFEGRLARLEEATKNINIYINPSEAKKLFEVKNDSTSTDAIKTGD